MIDIKYLAIHATDACQLRCEWCFARKNDRNLGLNPHIEDAIAFLCSSCQDWNIATGRRKVSVYFFGGEPLLFKDRLRNIIKDARNRYVKDTDISFTFITNLLAIDEEWISWCNNNQVFHHISLDGCQASQDMHRKFPDGSGSFEKTDANLQLLKRLAPWKKNARSTFSAKTAHLLKANLEYFESRGITTCAMVPSVDPIVPWTAESIVTLRTSVNDACDWLINRWADGSNIQWSDLGKAIRSLSVKKNTATCGAMSTYFGVDFYGNIVPCHRFCNSHGKQFAVGDVASATVDMARMGAFTKGVFDKLQQLGCAQCEMLHSGCRIICPQEASLYDVDVLRFHCIYAKIMREAAIKTAPFAPTTQPKC